MINNIMLDVETLSTDSNAVILTLAMVKFNIATGEIGDSLYIRLDKEEQLHYKGVIDKDTLEWWAKQDKQTKEELLKPEIFNIPLACIEINNFCEGVDYKLWGNGATFDNVIVRNLFKRSNMNFKIPYWYDRDVRTLVDLGNIDTHNYVFKGIKHSALDDCKHQINYCCDAYKALS